MLAQFLLRVVIFAPLLPLNKIWLKQELPLVLLIVIPCNTKSASSLDTLVTNADLIAGASQDGIDVARASFDTLGNNADLIAGASHLSEQNRSRWFGCMFII